MIRVFPQRNNWTPKDELAFVGYPGLFRPKNQPVKISCTFTWDIPIAEKLRIGWENFYDDVEVGGPAYGDKGGEFTPGMFLREGIVITSRGCSKNCKWCFVPGREGWIRELEIKPGWNIADNNLLACSMQHIKRVFDMLRLQKKPVSLSGGLDAEMFTAEHAALLKSVNLKEAWFACDYPGALEKLEKVSELLVDLNKNKKRCYVLIGFDGETIKQAEKRLEAVYKLDFMPFAMLYKSPEETSRNKNWSKDWLDFARIWCRPAGYKAIMKQKGF